MVLICTINSTKIGQMNNNPGSTTIKINLASGILENARLEANRIGISLQDFIRMLLGSYFAKTKDMAVINQDIVLLENAHQDIKAKKYKKIKDSKELSNYLENL